MRGLAVIAPFFTLFPALALAQPLRLRPAEVDTAAAKRLGRVTRCYREAVKRAPSTFGILQVGMRVAPDGAVSERWISMSTVGDPRLEECVIGAFEGLRFPAPGQPAVVRFGMLLTTENTPEAAKKAAEEAYKRSLKGT